MSDSDEKTSFQDLDRRIREAKARHAVPGGSQGPRNSAGQGLGVGLRIATDLVAGIAIGAGIGIVLDGLIGTAPLLLIVFFVVGTCAGFLNVYRTTQELDRKARAESEAETGAGG